MPSSSSMGEFSKTGALKLLVVVPFGLPSVSLVATWLCSVAFRGCCSSIVESLLLLALRTSLRRARLSAWVQAVTAWYWSWTFSSLVVSWKESACEYVSMHTHNHSRPLPRPRAADGRRCYCRQCYPPPPGRRRRCISAQLCRGRTVVTSSITAAATTARNTTAYRTTKKKTSTVINQKLQMWRALKISCLFV